MSHQAHTESSASATHVPLTAKGGSMAWRQMLARSPHESHRVASTLELLFDLVFVVAIATAAAQLHHALASGHAAHGVVSYLMVFFCIWWAWMNFSWFASAFDNDDVLYRIAVFVQMAGALLIAAAAEGAFEGHWLPMAMGYGVIRVVAVLQWLRAGRHNPHLRPATTRYAIGIFVLQLAWFALVLFGTPSVFMPVFVFLVVLELLVPMWAERAVMTSWHPHHIAERYGLLTLIVLGESILSTAKAVQGGIVEHFLDVGFMLACLGALLVIFCMWWLYFEEEGVAHRLNNYKTAFYWGYGHYFVFASAAAAGAGLAAQVDFRLGHAQGLSAQSVGFGLTIPVAIYVFTTWLIHKRVGQSRGAWVFPVAAVAVLVTPLFTEALNITTGVILALALVVRTWLTCQKRTEMA